MKVLPTVAPWLPTDSTVSIFDNLCANRSPNLRPHSRPAYAVFPPNVRRHPGSLEVVQYALGGFPLNTAWVWPERASELKLNTISGLLPKYSYAGAPARSL